ncbi:DUF6544 family protein [Metaclostridioides mangenotii]|uniref:DUF6544 family protein n=1 Tax=Metaclostridioides mangenotii TaxID=1540 RepID=UPI0026EEC672|nr:DUF6544 family protein [Clostridioides mangenotii]
MKIFITLIIIIGIVIIYLNLPYSPVIKEYSRLVDNSINSASKINNVITQNDLKKLPIQLQKYIVNNGYIDSNKYNHINFYCKDVDFVLDESKPKIKIDFTVNLFADNLKRFALIDSKIYGLPFQGLDIYENQKGFMKGVIAKNITLFNDNADYMNRGELTTYLAEGILFPSIFLNDKFSFEEIDDLSVKVTVKDGNLIEGGIAYFNNKYEITKFVVDKRYNSSTKSYEKWTCEYGLYRLNNGVKIPTSLKAVWNLKSGDLIYFDTNNINIS